MSAFSRLSRWATAACAAVMLLSAGIIDVCAQPVPPTPAAKPYPQTFGTGLSQGQLMTTETTYFMHEVAADSTSAVMTHFWITGDPACVDTSEWNYYLDGESSASVNFSPSLACGVGFEDPMAPWATRYFGHQSKTAAWFHNIRVPFSRSIKITGRTAVGVPQCLFYVIMRGSENLPITIGGVTLPPTARLQVQKVLNVLHQPLDFIPVAQVGAGAAGLLFIHTLAVQSPNINFLEGCYHSYTGANEPFPGTTISTGTEDYFTSAYYFDAGTFHSDVSGDTHMSTDANGVISWSAYRIHDDDPMMFRDGFRLDWRLGDVDDPLTGLKCTQLHGNMAGSPQPSNVTSYAWIYSWPLA